ncbi:E3 ubiquitin-protein ligase Mdm2 [Periophthalmus magnuspinnatus]|uniref:E3 ubiquitin-protein ligase Mdm2 n=1 Tax=Periophthalmus magnuspinnatus TaxID=409849 RepID=UPI00145B7CCB|nr:E3 ubiquitin-protein ligase Mdm2 [Periophthalmus magnuspinnatus]XP_033844908.1 E3 ubiquitin-protein ligase Mdm2 [Periophthalmus magnuspinnatus]
MSSEKDFNSDTPDDTKLVRPKVEFQSLLQLAGATKEIFTMKEVMFYLGQYIMQKQLYDQKQQHIVHCAQDALGQVLGVDSFSVKEPRALFAMLSKNLIAVKSHESLSSDGHSSNETNKTTEGDTESCASSLDRSRRRRRRRRRRFMSGDPGPSQSTEAADVEDESEEEEEGKKRRRSDSYSLTFDESLSWCVIGGLGGGRDRHSSRSSESHSNSGRSEITIPASDSDSDNFSVEFEVESIDSDDYDEDDASLSGDDQVYEVTIIEAEDEDSFDEDTEISEADYWKCGKCEEMNPPLPRHCQRCWTLRQHWLPEVIVKSDSGPKLLPPKPKESEAKESPGSDNEENEGIDVPDGKRAKTPLPSQSLDDSTVSVREFSCSAPNSQELSSSLPSSSSFSQEKPWTDSQPSSSDSQETLPCSPPVTTGATSEVSSGVTSGVTAASVPELERNVSAEWKLPDSCLDPCLICQSRPKNGCIVHGRTGHLMSCYVCARKLKKRNKLCPVCRMPIQSVILTYLS